MDFDFKKNYASNFAKDTTVDLETLISIWNITCPVEEPDSFKLYIILEIDHPSKSRPFFVFEKVNSHIQSSGTENCEILYGVNALPESDVYETNVRCMSRNKIQWFDFLFDAYKRKLLFRIKEIEIGEFFVRIVL